MFIHSLQTLLLAEILIEPPLNLALIQWYDFKSQTHPYMYGLELRTGQVGSGYLVNLNRIFFSGRFRSGNLI